MGNTLCRRWEEVDEMKCSGGQHLAAAVGKKQVRKRDKGLRRGLKDRGSCWFGVRKRLREGE